MFPRSLLIKIPLFVPRYRFTESLVKVLELAVSPKIPPTLFHPKPPFRER